MELLIDLLKKDIINDIEIKNYIEDSDIIIKECNVLINNIESQEKFELISIITNTYQLFCRNELNVIQISLNKIICEFYIKNIDKLIEKREDYLIYYLMDLFYCNEIYIETKYIEDILIKKTYPILLLETENSSTYIAIACFRFIDCFLYDNNFYLEKYLEETVDKRYEEEILEALRNQ